MLIGRFGNTSNAPFIDGRVSFPRLKVAIKTPSPGEADVSFLADTGADMTTLMPADLSRFLIDVSQLQNPIEVTGVSGIGHGFLEPALVSFSEHGVALRVYETQIIIMKPTPYIQTCASLLGRDIMSKWSLTLDTPNKRFSARVARADHTFKLSKGQIGLDPLPGISPPPRRD